MEQLANQNLDLNQKFESKIKFDHFFMLHQLLSTDPMNYKPERNLLEKIAEVQFDGGTNDNNVNFTIGEILNLFKSAYKIAKNPLTKIELIILQEIKNRLSNGTHKLVDSIYDFSEAEGCEQLLETLSSGLSSPSVNE